MPQYQQVDMNPRPNPIGQNLGESFVKGFTKSQEQNAMDRILSGIKPESSGEDVIKSIFGESGLPLDQKVKLSNEVSEVRKRASDAYQKQTKEREKKRHAESAFSLIKRQRQLADTGYLGSVISGIGESSRKDLIPTAAGRKARAEYSRIGKALISAASNIVIRNRAEFETLAGDLYDPEKSKEEIAGILDGMERIIKENLDDDIEGSSQGKTIEMRDAQGNVYDIPADKVQEAKSKGLIS